MKNFSVLFGLTLFLTPLISWSKKSQEIHVISFNVLAPWLANPRLYPTQSGPYLDRKLRRNQIIQFLRKNALDTDIIALQESTQTEFYFFKNALQKDFYAFQAYHHRDYWSNWITDLPWEEHGVALFVRKSTFCNVKFRDLPLTNDGNHSAYFVGVQCSTGARIRAASIHLDSDSEQNRHEELRALLGILSFQSGTMDVIAGDFNFGTHEGPIHEYLTFHKFTDVLAHLGREDWTCPYRNGEYQDRNFGILDHIVVRNGNPESGVVFNFGLWQLFPHDEEGRITRNIQISGSDHFPIRGTVTSSKVGSSRPITIR